MPIHFAPTPADQNHVFRYRALIAQAVRVDQISYPSIHIDWVANNMADAQRRGFVNLGVENR